MARYLHIYSCHLTWRTADREPFALLPCDLCRPGHAGSVTAYPPGPETVTMKINALLSFTLDRASPATCEQFSKPFGTYELMDPDGTRHCWIDAHNEPDEAQDIALRQVYDLIADATGIYNVKTYTKDA